MFCSSAFPFPSPSVVLPCFIIKAPFLETGYTLDTASLYSVGYMYVPDKCQANATTGVSANNSLSKGLRACIGT
jgi:hypothetical protein